MSDPQLPANFNDIVQRVLDGADQYGEMSDLQRSAWIGAMFLPRKANDDVWGEILGATPRGSALMLDADVTKELHRLKVQTEAERRLASENYSGSEELSWDDLEAVTRGWLIQDLVPEDGTVFTVARSNLGKTFSYIDAVCRMAVGLDWLGKTTRPAKVLIVLGEGRAGFMARLHAWMLHHGKTAADLKPYLSFIDRANLNNDESLARIVEVAQRDGVELVIYDTWSATSGVHKEEDNALNSATLNRVRDALPGLTHWFIHHPRKAEEDTDHPVMRGAGSLQGSADVVMTMYRDKGFKPASGESYDFIALSTEAEHNGKNRDAQTETVRGLFLEEVALDNGDVGRVLAQVNSEAISYDSRRVREKLTRPMSANEFILHSGLSKTTAYRALSKAVEEGVAVKEPQPMGPAIYRPTQAWSTLQNTAAQTPYSEKAS